MRGLQKQLSNNSNKNINKNSDKICLNYVIINDEKLKKLSLLVIQLYIFE